MPPRKGKEADGNPRFPQRPRLIGAVRAPPPPIEVGREKPPLRMLGIERPMLLGRPKNPLPRELPKLGRVTVLVRNGLVLGRAPPTRVLLPAERVTVEERPNDEGVRDTVP